LRHPANGSVVVGGHRPTPNLATATMELPAVNNSTRQHADRPARNAMLPCAIC